MQERHSNKTQYFEEQACTTQKYVIPFIEKGREIDSSFKVLEIGCGEAGNLKPFLDRGCQCVGIDYSERKIEQAKKNYAEHPNRENVLLLCSDIYDTADDLKTFDLIIVRDVLEHIHGHKMFLSVIRQYMDEHTLAFFAFPPWQNPFGGHQQMCRSFLSKVPYLHLLPKKLYSFVLKLFGESKEVIGGLLEIRDTRVSIEKFEYIVAEYYTVRQRELYFINPNYEVKFSLKPRTLWAWAKEIRYIRNYYTTCGYYLLQLC